MPTRRSRSIPKPSKPLVSDFGVRCVFRSSTARDRDGTSLLLGVKPPVYLPQVVVGDSNRERSLPHLR